MNEKYSLPEGWCWVRLGEVCKLLPSKSIAADGDTKVQAITTACLTESGFKPSGVKPTQMYKSDAALCIVSPGEILVARSNTLDLVGRVAMFSGKPEGVVATDLTIRIWPSNIMLSPFLAAFLSFLYINGYWKDRASGASGSMKKITRAQINDTKVPLAPIIEQRRIASKLQEMIQEVERAQTACEKQLEAAKALPAAYLRKVFESEEAKKWDRKRLGEVLEVIESGSRPKGGVFEIKEGIPSIGAEHLNSFGGFNFNNIRFIPNEFYKGMNRGKIQKGDVLVVKDGATTGKNSFVGDDFPYSFAAINEHVFRLRAKGFLRQEFLFWFLYSPIGQTQIQQEFHGAAQGGINQQFVNGVIIPIPSLSIQHHIAADLKEQTAQMKKVRTDTEKQLEVINVLPQAILRKAFRGEL